MSNEKEYFTNFHSHRFNCEYGDKDKFSMLPIGELLPLLDTLDNPEATKDRLREFQERIIVHD